MVVDVEHLVAISEGSLEGYSGDLWDVTCSCGFEVKTLSTSEAADDVVAWHKGEPSMLGGDL